MAAQGLTNLLQETIDILKQHNLTTKNIKYVTVENGYVSVADFIKMARNINYDAGWGIVHINPCLKIVGATWWLARETYDGSEKWVFLKKPQKPSLPALDFQLLGQFTNSN